MPFNFAKLKGSAMASFVTMNNDVRLAVGMPGCRSSYAGEPVGLLTT